MLGGRNGAWRSILSWAVTLLAHVLAKERAMTFLRSLGLSVILVIVAAGFVSAQDCSGTITADEAMKAEAARYAAQTKNDFAAMEKMFGSDLTYKIGRASCRERV